MCESAVVHLRNAEMSSIWCSIAGKTECICLGRGVILKLFSFKERFH